jgi:nucleotide-binding universal stress UspA family protein
MTTELSSSADDAVRDRIVVGYDGSSAATAAARYAVHLAPLMNADLHLVVAWKPPISIGGFPLSGWSQENSAQQSAGSMGRKLFEGEPPDWYSAGAIEGDAARVLMEDSASSSMLIVGSRGHGGLSGLILGSVSAECAAHASCPVLITHAQ